MFESRYLLVLIFVIVFKNSHQNFLSYADFPEERVEPPICNATTSGKSYCLSCVTSQLCFNNKPYNTACSGSKPYCGLDTSSPPKYACIASNVDCECPGTPGLSYKPDPFNSHLYTSCFGTSRVTVDCGAMYYNPQTNDCSGTEAPTPPPPPPSPCPATGTGGVFEDLDDETCDGFVVCSPSGELLDSGTCTNPPDTYFDPTIKNCGKPISPFRCPPEVIGFYADPFDCQRYYLCQGDSLILTDCCKETESWDNAAEACSATAECTELPPCASDGATT